MKSLKGDEPMYTIKQARMLRGKTQAEKEFKNNSQKRLTFYYLEHTIIV